MAERGPIDLGTLEEIGVQRSGAVYLSQSKKATLERLFAQKGLAIPLVGKGNEVDLGRLDSRQVALLMQVVLAEDDSGGLFDGDSPLGKGVE